MRVRREGRFNYGGRSDEAIIQGDWTLMQNDPFSPLELYHLKQDPQETKNLAATLPEKLWKLSVVLRRHLHRGGAVPWQPPAK